MDAHQARGVLQGGGDVLQLQAGGVGGQHGAGLGDALDVGEELALRFQVLEDRLDHDVGLAHALAGGIGNQAVEREAHLRVVAQLLLERRRGALDGRRDALDALVLQRHRQAAQRRPGGDVAAHDAGADHVQVLRREITVLAEALQALLQIVDADEVLRRRRGGDGVHRGRLVGRHGERIAAVVGPHVEDGVGRRVMLGAGALHDLLLCLRGDKPLERAVHQALHEGQLARRPAGRGQHARGVVHDARRHAFVGEAETLGALGVEGAAAKHHVERGGRADDLRQAQHAAPARHDAEHDFGQGDARARLVHRHAVAAGQREFRAAAHAVAANQRQGGVLHRGEAVVHVPAALHEGARAFGGFDLGELLDIGAGDEAGVLAGADHQRLGRLALEFIEHQAKFAHRRFGERVRRFAGLVESQPGEAGEFALEAPVLQFLHVHSFLSSASRHPEMRRTTDLRWPDDGLH